jgi:hypothetical protein
VHSRSRPGPEAIALLDEVRKRYQNLPAYHFERVLLAQEARKGGALETIAELTLTNATEGAQARDEIVVGSDRRMCRVIEGVIRPRPISPSRDSPQPPVLGLDFLLTMLVMQGLTEGDVRT